jgi:hypothetical protein
MLFNSGSGVMNEQQIADCIAPVIGPVFVIHDKCWSSVRTWPISGFRAGPRDEAMVWPCSTHPLRRQEKGKINHLMKEIPYS